MHSWKRISALLRFSPDPAHRAVLLSLSRQPQNRAAEFITAGLGTQSWSRLASWLDKYKSFLLVLARRAGHRHLSPPWFISNAAAVEFLATVAAERKGRTRVAAASRAIEFLRRLLKIAPLANDPRAEFLKRGVLRSNPKVPEGANPLPGLMLVVIVSSWGRSSVWWKRMVATLLLLALLSRM